MFADCDDSGIVDAVDIDCKFKRNIDYVVIQYEDSKFPGLFLE